mgnify:CR=1 FL=1|jgi:hypothetical protein
MKKLRIILLIALATLILSLIAIDLFNLNGEGNTAEFRKIIITTILIISIVGTMVFNKKKLKMDK